jgi:hypothetical protein
MEPPRLRSSKPLARPLARARSVSALSVDGSNNIPKAPPLVGQTEDDLALLGNKNSGIDQRVSFENLRPGGLTRNRSQNRLQPSFSFRRNSRGGVLGGSSRSLSVASDGTPMSGVSGGSGGLASNISRRSLNFRNSVARRSGALARFSRHSSMEDDFPSVQNTVNSTVYNSYSVGDVVLISNHNSRWANCVNKLGYPPGEGESFEEQRGPYIYVLGKVKIVHYEENAVFYTIKREDTGVDVRGDAGECPY